MRVIAHLSDLHFGRLDPLTIAPLRAALTALRPDLLVVSGDFTQRARTSEFEAARAFLQQLPTPQLVVPGNHDIPLHNPIARFHEPLRGYKTYISEDLAPFHLDDEIAVLGLNTARSLTLKDGRLNHAQMRLTRERLLTLPDTLVKVIVTHHPFDLPKSHTREAIVGRSREAMATFAECGVDMLLAGHFHVIHASQTAERYQIGGHSALVVSAGTATSSRVRGERNSFNVLHVDAPRILVERHTWDPERQDFTVTAADRFERTALGWLPAGKATAHLAGS